MVALTQVLTAVFLARSLGPDQYGKYALALAVTILLSAVAGAGLPAAIVYQLGRNPGSQRVLVVISLSYWLIVTVIVGVVGYLAITRFGDLLLPGLEPQVRWFALTSFPIVLLFSILSGFMQARQSFSILNASVTAASVSTLILAVYSVGKLEWGVIGAVGSWAIGQAIGLTVVVVGFRTPVSHQPVTYAVKALLRELWLFGRTATATSILSNLTYRLSFLLLHHLAGPAALGIYALAMQIAERVWLVSQSVQIVLFPQIAGRLLGQEGRMELVQRTNRVTLLLTCLGSVALYGMVFLFGGRVLTLEYRNLLLTPLVISLIGTTAYSVARVLGVCFAATGRVDLNLRLSAISFLAMFVLSLLLVPMFGAIGAATATSVGYIAASWFASRYFHKGHGGTVSNTFVPRFSDIEAFAASVQAQRLRRAKAAGTSQDR